jgi:HEAT repeat protein
MKVNLAFGSKLVAVSSLLATGLASGQAPPTVEQGLARLGISLDRASLQYALHDPRPAARGAAAAQLAFLKVTDAIPEIEEVIDHEENKMVVFTLAQSLNILGSAKGTIRLESYCSSTDQPPGMRILAASDLSDTGDYKCLAGVTEFLNSKDSGIKQSVLLYMLHIPSPQHDSPANLGPALLAIARGDSDPYFRGLAGKVIMQIGDKSTRSIYRQEHTK